MIQMYGMCVVWGEPLSQTAESFMPELLYGVEQSLEKVRNTNFTSFIYALTFMALRKSGQC